jgi:hypothetical protein
VTANLGVEACHQRAAGERIESKPAGDRAVDVHTGPDAACVELARARLFLCLPPRQPARDRNTQSSGGYALGQRAQLVLRLGSRDSCDDTNFRIGDTTFGERTIDEVEFLERFADAQPFACSTHLDVHSTGDPVCTRGCAVALPLVRALERRNELRQAVLARHELRPGLDDRGPQRLRPFGRLVRKVHN